MLTRIHNPKDIVAFAKLLISEGTNFHPDIDFNDCNNLETQQPTYTKAEADLRNELMNQCFTVCEQNGIDIYDTMSEVTLKKTGLDKFIPLPSEAYSE